MDHSVTSGHLCIKGRFGYEYVQELGDLAVTPDRRDSPQGARTAESTDR